MATNPGSDPTTSGDQTDAPQEKSRSSSASSLLGNIAQISGLVTVVAGTVYILGMVTLVVPISTTYQTPITVAWYMASLVPKTVIAGFGVKSLVWPALFTVIPIAFIVVLILTLMSLLRAGVRQESRRTRATGVSSTRGVLLMTAFFGVYSAILGGVILAADHLLGGLDSDIMEGFSTYHLLAALLAYAVFALWCVLALWLLTRRAVTYAIEQARDSSSSYEPLRTLGSLRVVLYLALYLGMASVAISGLQLLLVLLVGFEQERADFVLLVVWGAVLLSVFLLVPMALMVLLVDRALSTDMLDGLRPVFRMLGMALRILLNIVAVGTILAIIMSVYLGLFSIYLPAFAEWVSLSSGLDETLFDAAQHAFTAALGAFGLSFLVVLLLWLIGKLIPPVLLGVPRAMLVVTLGAVVVCDSAVLSAAISMASEALIVFCTIPLVVLSLAVVLLLVWRGGRYALRATRNVDFARIRPFLRNRRDHIRNAIADVPSGMLRYAGTFFVVIYLALAVTFLYGKYIVLGLVQAIESITVVDELLLWLWIGGGTLCGLLLYFKGLSYQAKEDIFSAKGPKSVLISVRNALLPGSIRWRGFILSLGGAYIFSVVTALLYITGLEEPPLPRVTVLHENNVQPQISAPVGGDVRATSYYLLAHTEGYWYLMDGREGTVLAVPDQDDFNVQIDPDYVEVVSESGALKVEVPAGWVEYISDAPALRPQDPPSLETSKLAVSSDVGDFETAGQAQYAEEGIFVQAYSAEEWAEWRDSPVGSDSLEKVLDERRQTYQVGCPAYDGRKDYVIATNGYRGRIDRSHDCTEEGSFTVLGTMPADRSFMVVIELKLPKGDEDKEGYILDSVEVKGDSLP